MEMRDKAVLGVFMPAYNAEKQIPNVLKRIPDTSWAAVRTLLIINDGSTDNSADVIHQMAFLYPKIRAIHSEQNMGYGATVKRGLMEMKKEGVEFAICLHADGQYAPELLLEFLFHARQDGTDILQGSRMASGTALKGGMPLYKFVAGKILTFLERKVFGLPLTDFHSGYLCYSRKALETLNFDRLSDSFDFDLEVIASAKRAKLCIGEMPISTRYADERSYLNPVTYGLRVVRVMIKFCLGKYELPDGHLSTETRDK